MFSPTNRPETYIRGNRTAIDLFLSGAKWLGSGASAAD